MINLGDKAKDKITGFMGVVTGRCIYLNGCVQYRIQPQKMHDGKIIEGEWIDEGQLVLMDKGIIEMERPVNGEFQEPARTKINLGGPQKNPPEGRF